MVTKHIRHLSAAGATAFLLVIVAITPTAHAYPYGGWGGYRGGWGGYRGCWGGYGGWYGTGIPNGLGWTMFGLGAAATVAAPVVAASYAAPVYAAPYPVNYYYQPGPQAVAAPQYSQAPRQSERSSPPNGTLEKAQEKLSGLGYYKGSVDGNYGPATAQAVQQFQADNGLPVTGRLDLKTLSSLGVAM